MIRLAEAFGKSPKELLEAVYDVINGQFDRIKEFGIRTRKENEYLIFTFKGIESRINFREDAIIDFIVDLSSKIK